MERYVEAYDVPAQKRLFRIDTCTNSVVKGTGAADPNDAACTDAWQPRSLAAVSYGNYVRGGARQLFYFVPQVWSQYVAQQGKLYVVDGLTGASIFAAQEWSPTPDSIDMVDHGMSSSTCMS